MLEILDRLDSVCEFGFDFVPFGVVMAEGIQHQWTVGFDIVPSHFSDFIFDDFPDVGGGVIM